MYVSGEAGHAPPRRPAGAVFAPPEIRSPLRTGFSVCAPKNGARVAARKLSADSASFMFGLPRHFYPFHGLDLIKWLTFKYFSTNVSSMLESVVRGFQYFQ